MTQKRTIQIFSFLALLTFSFSACQKTGDIIDPPTASELLADGAWKLTAQTVDPAIIVNNVAIENEFNQLFACQRDNLFNYNESGSFTLEEGDTKCDSADPQILETGTWSVDETESFLQRIVNSTTTNRTIQNLDRDELVLVEYWIDNGINYTRTFTYKHK